MKRYLLLFLFLPSCFLVKAQSTKQLLDLADIAFNQKNYSLAALYYERIIKTWSDSLGQGDIVFPYDVIDGFLLPKSRSGRTGNIYKERVDQSDSSIVPSKDTIQDTPRKINIDNPIYNYVVYQLAESYRMSYNYENAETWYKESMRMKDKKYRLSLFWYGVILMNNMKYNEAQEAFNQFIEEHPKVDVYYFNSAERHLKGCSFALKEIESFENQIIVREADTVLNFGVSNFAVNFTGDDSLLIFTSSLSDSIVFDENAVPAGRQGKQDELFFCDLFMVMKKHNGWSSPKNIGLPINTSIHEGAGVLFPGKKKLCFTRWDASGKSAIYISNYYNNRWLQPIKLNENVNSSRYNAMQPAFSPYDSILYFVSDRPAGQGKKDIWYCTIDEFGNVGEAYNLGDNINTPEDDVAPFYNSSTNTLYFSSDGHVVMGGLDVFKAVGSKTDWTGVENLGYPINSGRDDTYFIINENEISGYLTSDRKQCVNCNGRNCYNIYTFKYENIIIVNGFVFNDDTKEAIPDVLVILSDINNKEEAAYTITDETGWYSFKLKEDVIYKIKAQKIDFFSNGDSLSTVGIKKTTTLSRDIYLIPIPEGEIVLKGILYDYDKWNIRPKSAEILDKLMRILEQNPKLEIELASHTDSRGGDEYNLTLSQKRAESCVTYLITKGINPARITAVGYGEIQLLVKDARTEKEHQENRRTTFRVLSQDWEP